VTAELLSPSDGEPSAVQRIRALYQQRELDGGERLTTSVVAGEVAVSQTLAGAALRLLRTIEAADQQREAPQIDAYASKPSSYLVGSPVGSDRIAGLYRTREVADGEHLQPAEVAQAAGVSQRYAMLTLYVLRALDRQGPAPRTQWAAARARTAGPADRADLDLERRAIQGALGQDWRTRAACADSADPDLFFPERSEAWKAAKAKATCAGCAVQPACLELALRTQTSHQDDHGIFAGTSRNERLRLRGRAPIATPTRFFTDPDAAAEAFALARRVGVITAAERLGVSREALYHAFDRYGLGRPTGQRGSPPSRFLTDRHAAERVFQRAREVGITQAAEEAATSHRTLRKAWSRHGLGLPERIARPAAAPSLDRVFLGLPGNQAFARPVRASGAALWTRARRLEELETLGPRVVQEAAAENRARPATRVWTVSRRARQAVERPAAAASHPAMAETRAERLAAQARRRAASQREVAARGDRRTNRARTRAARDGERER
jgi:WhiB family transcriptional regulator, redox-sensing transcriptional regulator